MNIKNISICNRYNQFTKVITEQNKTTSDTNFKNLTTSNAKVIYNTRNQINNMSINNISNINTFKGGKISFNKKIFKKKLTRNLFTNNNQTYESRNLNNLNIKYVKKRILPNSLNVESNKSNIILNYKINKKFLYSIKEKVKLKIFNKYKNISNKFKNSYEVNTNNISNLKYKSCLYNLKITNQSSLINSSKNIDFSIINILDKNNLNYKINTRLLKKCSKFSSLKNINNIYNSQSLLFKNNKQNYYKNSKRNFNLIMKNFKFILKLFDNNKHFNFLILEKFIMCLIFIYKYNLKNYIINIIKIYNYWVAISLLYNLKNFFRELKNKSNYKSNFFNFILYNLTKHTLNTKYKISFFEIKIKILKNLNKDSYLKIFSNFFYFKIKTIILSETKYNKFHYNINLDQILKACFKNENLNYIIYKNKKCIAKLIFFKYFNNFKHNLYKLILLEFFLKYNLRYKTKFICIKYLNSFINYINFFKNYKDLYQISISNFLKTNRLKLNKYAMLKLKYIIIRLKYCNAEVSKINYLEYKIKDAIIFLKHIINLNVYIYTQILKNKLLIKHIFIITNLFKLYFNNFCLGNKFIFKTIYLNCKINYNIKKYKNAYKKSLIFANLKNNLIIKPSRKNINFKLYIFTIDNSKYIYNTTNKLILYRINSYNINNTYYNIFMSLNYSNYSSTINSPKINIFPFLNNKTLLYYNLNKNFDYRISKFCINYEFNCNSNYIHKNLFPTYKINYNYKSYKIEKVSNFCLYNYKIITDCNLFIESNKNIKNKYNYKDSNLIIINVINIYKIKSFLEILNNNYSKKLCDIDINIKEYINKNSIEKNISFNVDNISNSNKIFKSLEIVKIPIIQNYKPKNFQFPTSNINPNKKLVKNKSNLITRSKAVIQKKNINKTNICINIKNNQKEENSYNIFNSLNNNFMIDNIKKNSNLSISYSINNSILNKTQIISEKEDINNKTNYNIKKYRLKFRNKNISHSLNQINEIEEEYKPDIKTNYYFKKKAKIYKNLNHVHMFLDKYFNPKKYYFRVWRNTEVVVLNNNVIKI